MDELYQNVVAQGFIGLDRFYIPPEMRRDCKFGYKSDLWNCGLILFLLLSGNLPFDTAEDLDNNYYENQFESEFWRT